MATALSSIAAQEIVSACNADSSWEAALVNSAETEYPTAGAVDVTITWVQSSNNVIGRLESWNGSTGTGYVFTADADWGNVDTLRIYWEVGVDDFYIDLALPATYAMVENYQLEIRQFTLTYTLP